MLVTFEISFESISISTVLSIALLFPRMKIVGLKLNTFFMRKDIIFFLLLHIYIYIYILCLSSLHDSFFARISLFPCRGLGNPIV